MQKILFVCLGNICRSPLAEGILRTKISKAGLEAEVDSCGTAGYHIGEKPDHRSVEVAETHSVDLSTLRARQFHTGDFEVFDFIYVMDDSNLADVLKLAENDTQKNKVTRLLDLTDASNKNVPDPYYGGSDGFEKVYQMLDKACDKIIAKLKHAN